jgi:hypothetical protein
MHFGKYFYQNAILIACKDFIRALEIYKKLPVKIIRTKITAKFAKNAKYSYDRLCRIRRSNCLLPLFSERYVKLSLHTAQAFYNPLIGQQLFVMVIVSGLHIFFALSNIFVATFVSFLIPCLSFLETKYSVSR